MKNTPLLLFAVIVFCIPCHAKSSWNKGELWDLFRLGRIEEAKTIVLKNPELINSHDPSNQMTPLHGAARFGTPELILFFIQKGADVNAVEYNAFTPLHDASTGANAKMLILHGADTTKKDTWGNTPLQKAAEDVFNRPKFASVELCPAMLEAGAKLDILSALYLGKRAEVKQLVAADPSIIGKDEKTFNLWHNNTALGIAAESGDKELVELFLKHGAPVDGVTNHPMNRQMTPLTNVLIRKKHLDVAEILLKAGASIEVPIRSNQGPNLTLQQWSAQQPDPEIKALIQRYAEMRAKDKPRAEPVTKTKPQL